METVKLGEFIVTVDSESAISLKTGLSDNEAQNILWKSSKNPSLKDMEATQCFLSLRKEMNDLWQKIAVQMTNMGFYVGTGIEGRDKCRQKFANLQTSYLKFIDKTKATGEGKLKKPPFYEELNEILGCKDKTAPVIVIDSLLPIKNAISQCTPKTAANVILNTSNDTSQENSPSTSDRFANIKTTLKPNKNEIIEKICNNIRVNEENRKKEFKEMLEFLHKQSDQKHQQMMALINGLTKKRKRRNSGSDSN
ncbi:hypothetical protein ABEB36_015312 [Hypothenemus hampei]|uniref:Myb/SANT-like DNA-binding domain-containing protein n=1 Tax=Hypothenemus hampei TaxID=57062 RepID=A0ABD1DZU4_HYPHA